MAVEDHPKYAEWLEAQKQLTCAKAEAAKGNASQGDVDKAQAEYDRVSAEIG